MPDKKTTDSEIVKALKNYIKDIGCAKCGFKDKYLLVIIKSALNLINRLQAEKEALINGQETLQKYIATLQAENEELVGNIDRLKEQNEHYSHNVKEMTDSIRNYQKALEQVKAENERLKLFENKIAGFNSHIRVEDMLVFASSLEEWLEFCDNLKAEAYKEFAEKLKICLQGDIRYDNKILFECDIDNLLKGLVGEDNESKNKQ